MGVAVVEDQALALCPMRFFTANLYPRGRRRLGDLEGEMIAQHTAPGATVRGYVLSWRQDREEPGHAPRDAVQKGGGFRAATAIGLRAEPVPQEEEGLPAVVVADRCLVDRNVLEIGQVVAVAEDLIELGLHVAHIFFYALDPGEDVLRQERGRWDLGVLEHPVFGAVQGLAAKFGGDGHRLLPNCPRPRRGTPIGAGAVVGRSGAWRCCRHKAQVILPARGPG